MPWLQPFELTAGELVDFVGCEQPQDREGDPEPCMGFLVSSRFQAMGATASLALFTAQGVLANRIMARRHEPVSVT